MLEDAGLGAAVENAEPEDRAAADVIVPSNDDSGPARLILEKLGLPEPVA